MERVTEAMTEADFLERLYLVLSAVREGDLSPRIRPWTEENCEKVGKLVNELLDQLSRMITEVSRVNYEVGVMGQLGPQADVPGAKGDWKRMVDHVNQTASGVTAQIRNFQSIIHAIERGDFQRRATAPCHGELRQLRDSINRVISRMDGTRMEVHRRNHHEVDAVRGELTFPTEV